MSSSYHRPTVLVVDDSCEVLNGLCHLLRSDCNALIGFNGLEALALAASETPDLIVLDVTMPGMDGYEVLRRLKNDPVTQNIPVIFLTSPGPGVSEARALELGAIDFITKPYDPAILKLRMHNQLAYKRSLDQARAMSLEDGLTGIPNRRRFDEELEQEWNRAARHSKPVGMILMDIDHFKRLNDAAGHPEGDACLQRVAAVLKTSLKRSMDFVARYGGEEFACILPETDLSGTRGVAAHIQAQLAKEAIPHPDSPVSPFVTLSMGAVSLIPLRGQCPQELTQEADRRLYAAKHRGRNRIHSEPVQSLLSPPPPSLLLVEDHPVQRSKWMEKLSFLDIQIHSAHSAEEAMTIMLRTPPSLVLSAGSMAEMDGYALCTWTKENPSLRGIPFAILAGTPEDSWDRTAESGADDFFRPGEDSAVFRARVRLLLELGFLPDSNRASISGASFLLLSPPGSRRSSLLSQFSMEGIRTTLASDLEETLQALKHGIPDALILDLELLEWDPAEALDHIHEIPGCKNLPILVMATTDQRLLVEVLESRIQDRLQLPLDPLECRHRARLLARCAFARNRKEDTLTLNPTS